MSRGKAPQILQTSLATNVPKFGGHENESVEFFLEQINSIARLEQWSEEKKLLIIKLNCTDKAQQYISTDPLASRANSVVALQDLLKQKFCRVQTFSQLQKEFSNISQTPSKSVKEIAELIEKCGNAYLEINNDSSEEVKNLSEKIKLNKFLEAIRTDLRIEVKKQNPQNFKKAVKIANNIENALEGVPCQSNSMQSIDILTLCQGQIETNNRILELTKQVEELKNSKIVNNVRMQEDSRNSQNLFCLICGKRHLTIKCWHFNKFTGNYNSELRDHSQGYGEQQSDFRQPNRGQDNNSYGRNNSYRYRGQNSSRFNSGRFSDRTFRGNRFSREHPYRRHLNY